MVAFNKYCHILAFSLVFCLFLPDATSITVGQVANLETFEDWKKSPSFLEVALYVKPHSLLSRSKKLKNFIEVAAYQRSFTVIQTCKNKGFFSKIIVIRFLCFLANQVMQCNFYRIFA